MMSIQGSMGFQVLIVESLAVLAEARIDLLTAAQPRRIELG
jgi:hypothetical protein